MKSRTIPSQPARGRPRLRPDPRGAGANRRPGSAGASVRRENAFPLRIIKIPRAGRGRLEPCRSGCLIRLRWHRKKCPLRGESFRCSHTGKDEGILVLIPRTSAGLGPSPGPPSRKASRASVIGRPYFRLRARGEQIAFAPLNCPSPGPSRSTSCGLFAAVFEFYQAAALPRA